MSFNSPGFIVFFLAVFLVYLVLDRPGQNKLLLAASCFFYAMWDWRFLSLLFLSISVDFLCGLRIEASADKGTRRKYLLVSLGVNLGVLCVFKYANFFIDGFLAMGSWLGLEAGRRWLDIILPVGISFYTFKTLSYTIDVYRRQVKACRSFVDYALYVSFFPQILSGPIERARSLLPQLAADRKATGEALREGILLVYWGLFKKVLIADNLGLLATELLTAGEGYSGASVLVGLYALSFQIYCDFSGYTDMARGLAGMMGFRTVENFRTPFLSENLQDFWNRWHISLTSWIRDYLYYPLALSRIGGVKIDVRLLPVLTFAIMGLWHGASWNFVVWGVYHGSLLALYMLLLSRMGRFQGAAARKPPRALWKVAKVLAVFNLFAVGGVFFHAGSIGQSFDMLRTMLLDFRIDGRVLSLSARCMGYILPFMLAELLQKRYGEVAAFLRAPRLVRYSLASVLFYLLAVHGSRASSFIYMQF